jgi:hypothetical protein
VLHFLGYDGKPVGQDFAMDISHFFYHAFSPKASAENAPRRGSPIVTHREHRGEQNITLVFSIGYAVIVASLPAAFIVLAMHWMHERR